MTAIETDGGGGEDIPRKKLSGKKIVLFIVLPILLIGGGAAGVIFSGILDGGAEEEHVDEEMKPIDPKAPPVYFEMPEILVNLMTGERRPVFLKMKITLELTDPQEVLRMPEVLPRITDTFQVYLRELRPDDLKGSAGLYRLREELLLRSSAAAAPLRIRDVLISEFLVQ
ncbi:MAG TPA: flagellar basal body-associated FliL family protein [Azospirillaceae bacterium]|nr:flagellar basal body-associated FliL family protein [Azospirillaceae bacterium]